MVSGGKRENLVLVVDDSPDTLGMLNTALEQANMTTLVALEGKQALNIVKKMAPDIILLDAIMPVMDGFETCRQLKADVDSKNIPVIFMTGLSDTESVVRGFEVGGVDYLTKPINPKELVARINVHLMNARTSQGAQSALDNAGQSICAVSDNGVKIWATPLVERTLLQLDNIAELTAFEQSLCTWLQRRPEEGNRCHFAAGSFSISVVYLGLSSTQEHLVRISNDCAFDEQTLLRGAFSITSRESEVLVWLTKGKTNREIAQILEMSPRTVNKHLEQLYRKLDVDNRTTAAAKAIMGIQKSMGGTQR